MTAKAAPRHWAQINEVTFVAGIRFLFVLYRLFGRAFFRLLVHPPVLFYIATNPRARVASRAYLRRLYRAMGRSPDDVGAGLVFQHFVSFSEYILDKVRMWSNPSDAIHVEWHDRQIMADQIALGRGGLIIASHLGNIDLCRALSPQRRGLKLTVLAHTKHAQAFNRLLAELNPLTTLNVWQVTDLSPEMAIRIGEKIDAGEFVVIAGDRVPVSPDPRIAYADFLGEAAPFPVGPYILANALRCPTYLLFCLRRGDDYHVYYELFRDRIDLPRRDRELALTGLAAAFASRLDHYCRLAPLEWFNFYDFWAKPGAGGSGG
jgi:predicted LPLAT superfamily acyltransferase